MYKGLHTTTHTDTKTYMCMPLHLHIIADMLISYGINTYTHTHKHGCTNSGMPGVLMTCACVCEGVGVCFELGRGEAEDELTMAANNYRSVVWRS